MVTHYCKFLLPSCKIFDTLMQNLITDNIVNNRTPSHLNARHQRFPLFSFKIIRSWSFIKFTSSLLLIHSFILASSFPYHLPLLFLLHLARNSALKLSYPAIKISQNTNSPLLTE